MKKAFSTLACHELGLGELLSLAEKHGMEAIEIRLDREDRMCGYDLDTIEKAKKILSGSRVVISDLGTGITFDGREDKSQQIERCARLAQAVGAPALRVFASASVKHPNEITDQDTERAAAMLQLSADVAARYGIELWIETHSAFSTGKSVAALLSKVQKSNVRVIWDIMHSIEFGESPEESVKYLGDFLVHVHLKDGVPPEGGENMHYRLTALEKGAVSFEEIATALSSISYDGYLSLEWELMWHPELGACYPSIDALLDAYRALLERWF